MTRRFLSQATSVRPKTPAWHRCILFWSVNTIVMSTRRKPMIASLSGEELYQQGRRWVGAIIQQITYSEFLPAMLGETPLPEYTGYDPQVDPSISAAFSGAAFRVGHSMQTAEILRLNEDGSPLAGGSLPLANTFFNSQTLLDDGIEPYLLGLIQQQANEVDTEEIDALRNFLFGPPGAGGMDLVSINIQRGPRPRSARLQPSPPGLRSGCRDVV